MKKSWLLFFLILATVLSSKAQMIIPPYRYFVVTDPVTVSNPADSFYYARQYKKAADAYVKMISEEGAGEDLLFNLAGAYAMAGEIDSAFSKLATLTEKGFFNIDYLMRNNDFASIRMMPQWKKIEQATRLNLENHEKKENLLLPEVRRRLLDMSAIDQFTDQVLFLQRAYNAYPEYDTTALRANKRLVYSSGTQLIKQITEQYGATGKSKVGKDGAEAYWTIVQHSDADPATQEEILTLMREAAKGGEFTLIQIAFLTDRVRKNKNEPQIYGTQYWKNPANGKWELYTVEDRDKLNERRKEMGLPSLEESNRSKIH